MFLPASLRQILEERKASALTPAQKRMYKCQLSESGKHPLQYVINVCCVLALILIPVCIYAAVVSDEFGHLPRTMIKEKNQTKKSLADNASK